MIRKILLTVALAAVTGAASAAAPDANVSGPTLSVGKGTVMISNGSQFVTAKPGQVLKAGDRVMVLDGGSATLNYADGRKALLPAGSLADIGSTNGVVTVDGKKQVGSMYAQAVGDKDSNDGCGNDQLSKAVGDNDNRRVCEDDQGRITHSGGYLADSHGFILDKDGNRSKCKCGVAWWNGTGVGGLSSDQQFVATFAAWTAVTACGIHEICNGSHEHPISAP